jgi:hypothetical protein
MPSTIPSSVPKIPFLHCHYQENVGSSLHPNIKRSTDGVEKLYLSMTEVYNFAECRKVLLIVFWEPQYNADQTDTA